MAKAVKQHWLSAAVITTVVMILVAWLVMGLCVTRPQAAQAAIVEALPALDPYSFDQIGLLREHLCLTNEDLAALGCDVGTATSVLTAVRHWFEVNKAQWEQAGQQELEARNALAEALQKVNLGGEKDAVTAIPRCQELLAAASAAKLKIAEGLEAAATNCLSYSQREFWQTARSNAGLPQYYRYLPGLTPKQVSDLRGALIIGTPFSEAEEKVLSPLQLTALQASIEQINLLAPSVTAASSAILPEPTWN